MAETTVSKKVPKAKQRDANVDVFSDRRLKDRRKTHQPHLIPTGGDRRQQDRRDLNSCYDPRPWWLKTSYVEFNRLPGTRKKAPNK